MRRRLILFTAAALPTIAAISAVSHGCSTEQDFESVCLWMADPNNCYRDFREGMKAAANPLSPDNPSGDCKPAGNPTEASSGMPGTENGTFLSRAKLDVCLLDQGGQVVLDPPLDLTMWPPNPFNPPVTYTITFTAPDGNPCGVATYTSPHGFSLTINALPDGGIGTGDGGGDASTSPAIPLDASPNEVSNGTFTEVIAPGSDAFDVTCPSGESHHFNFNEVSSGDGGTCPAFVNFVPSASFQVFTGGTDTAGAISFAIVYPPIPPTSGADTYPTDASAPPTAGDSVVYFNCTIPGGAEQCANGAKDGAETDVDCGGPQAGSTTQPCGSCPPRCAAMQQCLCDDDCDQTHGTQVCAVVAMGMRQCSSPDAGLGHTTCAWKDTKPVACVDGGTGTGGSGTGGSGTGGSPVDAGSDGPSDASDGG